MKPDAESVATDPGFFRRALVTYQKETGQPLAVWAGIAALNFIAQIFLHRELHLGEFGTLNTALAVVGLLTLPLLAFSQAFSLYLKQVHPPEQAPRIEALRAAAVIATETFGWIWGGLSILLIFVLLPLLDVPRISLHVFTVINVLVALGGVLSWAICQNGNRLRFWAVLLLYAALSRALVGALLGWLEPWAESGMAALLLAGFIALAPALDIREVKPALRWKACRDVWDRDFLLYAGATFSVLLGVFLFTNADRIVAQKWLGVAINNNLGIVPWSLLDAYQTAGLLGRSLLWGTQPLLWILFAHRSPLNRTTTASLTFFWVYLGSLVAGAFLLGVLTRPLCYLFCGSNYQPTALFVPSFAAVMVVLGLLQGVGIFALASRRYPECFLFSACSIGYAVLLDLAGRQAQSMIAYMFGAGVVSLMIVLFVGVVRWGRKQP
jgi:hypothetical protein